MVLKKTLSIGLVQAVLWTLMSLLCLIFHYRSEPSKVPYTYSGMFYSLFLAHQKHLTFKFARTLKSCSFAYIVVTIFDVILFISISIDFRSLCKSEPYYYNGFGYITEKVEMLCTKGFIPVWVISIRFGFMFITNIYSANLLRRAANLINLELIAEAQRLNSAQEINISAEDRAIDNNAIDNNYMYSPSHNNSFYTPLEYEQEFNQMNRMRSVYTLEYSYQNNPLTGQFEYGLTPGYRMQNY